MENMAVAMDNKMTESLMECLTDCLMEKNSKKTKMIISEEMVILEEKTLEEMILEVIMMAFDDNY